MIIPRARTAFITAADEVDRQSPRNQRLFSDPSSCCVRKLLGWTGGPVGAKGTAKDWARQRNTACLTDTDVRAPPEYCYSVAGPAGDKKLMVLRSRASHSAHQPLLRLEH